MEFKTIPLGSIKGGNAGKHIIYKHKDKPGWSFPSQYRDEHEAWEAVRAAFVEAFKRADEAEWEDIDVIEALRWGSALKVKALHTYFPESVLPIYGWNDLKHFLGLFGHPEASDKSYDVVRLNRALLATVRKRPEFKDWSNVEIMRFLYDWADPREAPRVVKIAPGDDAKYWDECLEGGYICVGWDRVGDLREFESKEAFRSRFEQEFWGEYKNNASKITEKANEVWTLRELEPGDIVVANKGISKVLAVGEVVEPGYEWSDEREHYRHLVRVKWDTSYEKQIAPQKSWGVKTVAKVPAVLLQTIMSKTNGSSTPKPRKTDIKIPVDPLFPEIAKALGRKGQLILYGPPGTGKTFAARRFAVWWLLREGGSDEAAEVLVDIERFAQAERALSTVQVARRVWWVVADPQKWSWDKLFAEGKVEYRYGLLQRNYPLVQPGDLVVGYQSSPDRRIRAIAKITKGFESRAGAEPTIELAPVTKVAAGLTFADLQADRVLSASEPMRFNVRGTLFALTAEEADHLFALLIDRDPNFRVPEESASVGIGAITRLTFHPSYSYEDFIEGFRPVDTGSGTLVLRLEDGVFKRLCRDAQANPKRTYLLLIDEINRANLAKVFGETITLIEKDKRGMLVTLPQSKESFAVPPNVFILGTMNTADRSIKLLDAALRRRFAFIELMPDTELLRGASVGTLMLDEFLEGLNRRVAKTEGREKQIGHSFLLDGATPVADADEFARRFRQEILPLLQEYCYEDYSALAGYIGEKIVNREANSLDVECLNDPEALIEALAEEFNCGEGS
jgi:5-methylcytosine-specific restriction protein B